MSAQRLDAGNPVKVPSEDGLSARMMIIGINILGDLVAAGLALTWRIAVSRKRALWAQKAIGVGNGDACTTDGSQRMLNALEPGTVMPIHRHRASSETVVIIRGKIQWVFYDDDGNETERVTLDA